MTAIYSGIHLKLKSPQTLWEDKLKLARFAWTSNQCLLPNKEQVLLDWCTHALTGWYNHKVQFSHAVLEGLWCYLDNLLHSRKLHTLLKQGKTITLRLNMAQLLLERLHECAQDGSKSAVSVSTILSVCQGLLSSPALSSVFTTKYELMVDLLAKLSTLACHELKRPLFMEPMMTESLTCQDEVMPDCLQNQHLDNFLTEPISENPPDQLELVANESHPKPKENVQSASLFDILLQVLSFYLSVQRQQANPNRVFTMVTNQLIQTLVLLRHLLTSGDFAPSHTHLHLRQQLCRDIRTKIDSILHLALFPIEQLNSYKEELLPSKDDSGKRGPGGGKGPLKPVSAILSKLSAQVHCETLLHYTVKSVTLSLLFKFFLESYGKGKAESQEAHRMLGFNFLTRLVPALNIDLDGHSPSPAKADLPVSLSPGENSTLKFLNSPESWSLALLSLESLLSQALSADIYNVAADRIRHGEVQLKFYRALAQMLFNQAQPSIPAWYRCLKMLLSLNHLILEPNLDQLSSLAWINSECMEARVQRARQLMVCSLLQTYTKLRQLPCLFSELLSVICQSALNHLRPPLLSEGISSSLRTCLLDTPPSQVLEICSLVLENIKRYILPNLVKEDRGSEEMEIDGVGDHISDQKKDDASLKLFSMSQILHVVLFSLKTLDHTSPLPIVRQSQGLIEEMQHVGKDLIQMLKNERRTVNANEKSIQSTPRKEKKKLDHQDPEKVSESKMGALWEQRTQEAALLLRYTLVEVDMLLYMHCSKYIPLDSTETTVATKTQGCSPGLMHLESLTFGEEFPAHLKTSNSPISCLLLKILTLQQMKKVLFNRCPLLSEPSTATILNRAAKFILAKSDFEASLDGEKEWDGQIWSVKAGSYIVAHWSLITSNLPLIVPYMNGEDVDCVADALVSSLLCKRTERGGNLPSGCLNVSFISSQLLHSHAFAELPSLFSATLHSLTQRIICVFKTAHAQKVCPTLLKFQLTGNSLKKNEIQPLSSLIEMGTIVEDILASTKTGEVAVLLTNTQRKEMANIIQIITELHPDGMNSEDISSIFFLLLFMLTSSAGQSDQMAVDCPGDYVVFLAKLLRTLTCLLEGRHFQSVLKYIHGGTLLQAVMSSLLWHSNNVKIQAPCSPDWLELVKALQAFIRCLVQLIIVRNSSVRLNLDQFSTYLASKEMPIRQIGTPGSADVFGKADLGTSILSVYLLLASLTSFSQTLSSNLGRNKQIDQTLRQMLTRATASLGPAVESVLKPSVHSHSVIQPTSILGQSFIVEVVTVMLQCELSSMSVVEGKQSYDELIHMSLYQTFCLQILKEVSSAQRPMDFLVSSLHFLSIFYKATRKMKIQQEEGEETKGGKELDELYMHILQKVHRLLAVSWLSSNDVCELEPAVEELLQCLVEKCNTHQFNLMLLAINQRMDIGQLRAGNYREVLSAVIVFKLLARCQLPDPCSRALWHFAPQILSAMVFLVRSSSQDISLTLPFTIPAVISMTSVLRQGEGLITNPHHVILVLGALQFVPLDHLTPVVYQSAFLSVHEAMFTLIQCHPQVMLNAAPTFLNIFHRLVTSIMQEGRQRGDSVTGPDGGVYLECSRLIERMYSHIAATPESFTTLSAFMVAQYVTELQKVTLRPDIKQHLTEGIYRILDLCMEQDIKFLTVGLQMGVREVFNELYASYTRYHKAQRQGEEKYTV